MFQRNNLYNKTAQILSNVNYIRIFEIGSILRYVLRRLNLLFISVRVEDAYYLCVEFHLSLLCILTVKDNYIYVYASGYHLNVLFSLCRIYSSLNLNNFEIVRNHTLSNQFTSSQSLDVTFLSGGILIDSTDDRW